MAGFDCLYWDSTCWVHYYLLEFGQFYAPGHLGEAASIIIISPYNSTGTSLRWRNLSKIA
jgi:hypothetical protein